MATAPVEDDDRRKDHRPQGVGPAPSGPDRSGWVWPCHCRWWRWRRRARPHRPTVSLPPRPSEPTRRGWGHSPEWHFPCRSTHSLHCPVWVQLTAGPPAPPWASVEPRTVRPWPAPMTEGHDGPVRTFREPSAISRPSGAATPTAARRSVKASNRRPPRRSSSTPLTAATHGRKWPRLPACSRCRR